MPDVIENQYMWNAKKAQAAERSRKNKLAYQRARKWHPDNDLVKHKLEMTPCPCCDNLTVRSDMKNCRYVRGKGYYRKDYWAKCDKCAATGKWPVTGMPVDFIVAAIQRQMRLGIVKALMAP